jgi:SH3 domain protein
MRLKPFLPALLLSLAFTIGCERASVGSREHAYVSAPQTFLRDRVSAVYNKVGIINNGERVTILQRDRRFVKVRTDKGLEGWVEQRYLVGDDVYHQLDDLAKKYANAKGEARATARADVNMHVTPARDSDKLFQIKENDKVELLQRAVQNKNAITKVAAPKKPKQDPKALKAQAKEAEKKSDKLALPPPPAAPKPPEFAYQMTPKTEDGTSESQGKPVVFDPGPPEDWWLVRDSHGRVGWVLGRMLDVDVPMEIAQYAEGKRVVAAYVLNTVEDPESDKPEHKVPYYLMLTNEPHDGQSQDFNGIRVFTWNLKKHRYETAYRDHDLTGVLPVTVAREDFGKEGLLPTFTIRAKDEFGAVREKKYRMEGVIVKRVYAPGEQPEAKAQRKKAEGKAVSASGKVHSRKRR